MKEINTLVFSGGSMKSISYVGVFKKLEEMKLKNDTNYNMNIKTICGVSAGTMFSLVYLLGYTYIEMLEEILNTKFEKLKNITIVNLLTKYGLDSGDLLIKWLGNLMIRKNTSNEITFLELYDKTNIDFQVMATNLNKYNYIKFNHISTPNMKVLDAIRMSISIPFIFTINKYNGDIIVDGGLRDNYPISEFVDNLDNVLGFKLTNHGELKEHVINEEINGIEKYIYHIFFCYIIQKEKYISQNDHYKDCTVYINTGNITSSGSFMMHPRDKQKLIDIGYDTISQFFTENQYIKNT